MNKINLVLSSSQQMHNSCAMGDVEQDHTQSITKAIFAKMSKDNRLNVYCIPKLSNCSDSANLIECVRLSNEFINANGGTGFHLSVHTDGGYSGTGSSGFYFSDNGRGFGLSIFQEMSALTPWKDMQFKERDGLYELKHTKAVSFLLEVAFHDKLDQAKWIHENIDNIADAIIRGIYKGIGLEPYKPDGELEKALEFLCKKSGLDYKTWLDNARSRKLAFLDLAFEKIATAWQNDLKGKV